MIVTSEAATKVRPSEDSKVLPTFEGFGIEVVVPSWLILP